ncbi:MAG: hypothetical protein OXF84_01875 [Bacteroidetes bacterium]|nr:hypothetical protein [Bacteroidota bacterium]
MSKKSDLQTPKIDLKTATAKAQALAKSVLATKPKPRQPNKPIIFTTIEF